MTGYCRYGAYEDGDQPAWMMDGDGDGYDDTVDEIQAMREREKAIEKEKVSGLDMTQYACWRGMHIAQYMIYLADSSNERGANAFELVSTDGSSNGDERTGADCD